MPLYVLHISLRLFIHRQVDTVTDLHIFVLYTTPQLFSWFADADNFLGATRKAYSDLFPFPSRYILPLQLRKAAVQRVQKYGGSVESGALISAEHTKVKKKSIAIVDCCGEAQVHFHTCEHHLKVESQYAYAILLPRSMI